MNDNKEYCANCTRLVECDGKSYCNELGKDIENIDVCPEGTFDCENEKYYIVPVTWEMCGFVKVKAKSAEHAFDKVKDDEEGYPLPEEKNYIEGSFSPSFDTPEMIEEYTKMYEKGELNVRL